MSETLYQIQGLTRFYGSTLALKLESLTIQTGTIIGLAGPNGSGKSTLLRILALVDAPTGGRLVFGGRSDNLVDPSIRRQATLLDQTPYLLRRSVLENVAYGLRVRRQTADLRRQVTEALSWVGLGAEEFAQRPAHQLSGGEAQRVALAARLILKPRALLLDEPTASVDAASASLILAAALRARQEWGTTIIIASHDLIWLFEASDEVLNLFRGRLAGSGVINLLPGPWARDSQGRCALPQPSGQRLTLPPPPPGAVAVVVRPEDLSLLQAQPEEEAENLLQGEVVQLRLDKPSGQVLVSVAVGRFGLTARVNKTLSSDPPLYPGKKVWLRLEPSSVRWV